MFGKGKRRTKARSRVLHKVYDAGEPSTLATRRNAFSTPNHPHQNTSVDRPRRSR
jgi:hypothetical protein